MDHGRAQGEVANGEKRIMNSTHEKEIVWLDDRSKYRYLREVQYPVWSRTTKPRYSIVPGKLVAYATLKPTATADSPGMFVRRLFYVTARDPLAGVPYEGVDPYSVHPGIPAMRGSPDISLWAEWQRAARVLSMGNHKSSVTMS
jgi:hypothetical protein